MQFPWHRIAPHIHIVGIATFVETIESSPNRIACETAPSVRYQRARGPYIVRLCAPAIGLTGSSHFGVWGVVLAWGRGLPDD